MEISGFELPENWLAIDDITFKSRINLSAIADESGSEVWVEELIDRDVYDVEFTSRQNLQPYFEGIENSMAPILGFEKVYKRDKLVHTPGQNDTEYLDSLYKLTLFSEKNVTITPINKIHLNFDCILGSIKTGKESPTLYTFASVSSPGYGIFEIPTNVLYETMKTRPE